MGLDFSIRKYPVGSNMGEEVCYGRNCYGVRDLVIANLRNYDEENCTALLTLTDLNSMLRLLVNEVKNTDFNGELCYSDDIAKTYNFIGQLALEISKSINDKCWDNMTEYEYELCNSF